MSQEARVIVARSKQETKGRPRSMIDFPSTLECVSPTTEKNSSPRHSRRHTIPDVKMELSRLTKKERRHLQRALSPQLSSEDGGAGTPKANKKLKKLQRGKDRDDKTDFLQESAPSSRNPMMAEISRTASVGGDITGGKEYLDFIGHRHVTESLNPSAIHRVESDIERRRERLRRTNSDLHITLGGGSKERRCPPERKQFYRQYIKSIKFYGISSTAANRMETPAPSHMPRFHSENLAMSNPYSPKMERLWSELQAYLRDKSPEVYEQWMFFNQASVDRVLRKVLHYSCTDVDCTQSLTSLRLPSREGYEPIHGSYSTSSLGVLKKAGTARGAGYLEALGAGMLREAGPPYAAEVCPVNGAGTPSNLFVPSECGLQWCVIREPMQCGVQVSAQGSDPELSKSGGCKVEYKNFLSILQQRALTEVDQLLCELDEVECLFMNRKQIGDGYPTYRTKFFKRRVCALNLYHKVTHGLAENLCQLSNWLGVAVLLPDICLDTPTASPNTCRRSEPSSSSSLQPPLSPSSIGRLSSSCMASEGSGPPQSPLTSSIRLQFLVGSPDDPADFLTQSGSETSQVPQGIVVQVPGSDGGSMSSGSSVIKLRKLKSQESRQDVYREFVSRALKREGIAFTVTVSRVSFPYSLTHVLL